MSEELIPVRCGCGGEAIVDQTDGYDEYQVYCPKCFMRSGTFDTESEAITAWNRAMGKPKGKWIDEKPNLYTRVVYCSECGCMALSKVKLEGDVYNSRNKIEFAKSNFCPNCGADMRLQNI